MIQTSFRKLKTYIILFLLFSVVISCSKQNQITEVINNEKHNIPDSAIITDCNYTFEEAIQGTKAPKHIIEQLELITVMYYSMDGKIHQGQILTNKKIAEDIKTVFEFILEVKFPVFQVVPVVRYHWNDKRSMEANNTYSFCYRNVSYSKHATGMAIDINPMQNPLIWKDGYRHRKNAPRGAMYNPEVPGTFTPEHPVVEKFKMKGFIWGYHFKRNWDKHHFEKIR